MKIVFFGDSITESGRNLLDPNDLGVGYVKIAAGKLRLLYPDEKIEIVNRGAKRQLCSQHKELKRTSTKVSRLIPSNLTVI